jgi:hypothetical protein
MPDQLRMIVDRMLEAVVAKGTPKTSSDKQQAPLEHLNLQEFTIFLD